jgi:hypothetical protein
VINEHGGFANTGKLAGEIRRQCGFSTAAFGVSD